MSSAGGGGALENFDLQGRLGELLQTLGAEQAEGATKTENSTTTTQTRDTTSKSDTTTTQSTIDPSNPSLVPPNTRKSGDGGLGAYTGNGEGTGSVGIQVPDGTEVTPELQQLIDYSIQEPGVKGLYMLVGDEKVTLALLNEFFEAEGIAVPVSPGSSKLTEAAHYGLVQFFTKAEVSAPEAKANLIMAGANSVKVIGNYFDFVSNIDPTTSTVNSAEGQKMIDGYLLSAEELVSQIVEELESGAVSDSAPEGLLDYLKFIANLVVQIRQIMAKISFEDSEKSGEVGVLMSKVSDMQRDEVRKQYETMHEKLKLQESMEYIEHFMKILTPVMGSTSILMAMVLLPINPVLGLILLAIAITFFVVTTSLQQTEKMDNMFRWFNKLIHGSLGEILEKIGLDKGAAEDWSEVIFWISFITVSVAAVAILGAAPFIGAVIPAVFMPMIMTVLSESGMMDIIMEQFQKLTGISDIVKAILTGVIVMAFSLVVMIVSEIAGIISEIQTELIKLVVGFVIEVIVLIVKAILSAATAGVGAVISAILYIVKMVIAALKAITGFLKGLIWVIKILMKSMQGIVKLTMQAVRKLFQAIKAILSAVKTVMKWIEQFMDDLQKMIEDIVDALEELSEDIRDAIDTIQKSTFGQVIKQIKQFQKYAKKVIDEIKDLATQAVTESMQILNTSTQATNQGVNALVSAGLGGLQLKLADFTEEEGEIEKLIKILSAMLKQLEALLEKVKGKHESESGGDEFTVQIKEAAKMFEQLIQNMSGISDELAASAVV